MSTNKILTFYHFFSPSTTFETGCRSLFVFHPLLSKKYQSLAYRLIWCNNASSPAPASVNIRKQVWYPPALAQCQEYSEFPYKILVTASHVAPPPSWLRDVLAGRRAGPEFLSSARCGAPEGLAGAANGTVARAYHGATSLPGLGAVGDVHRSTCAPILMRRRLPAAAAGASSSARSGGVRPRRRPPRASRHRSRP